MTQDASSPPRIHPGTYWLIAFLMAGGILVFFSYLREHNRAAREQYNSLHGLGPTVRPPLVGKLEKDLEATNRNGETVHLADLKGKVWLGNYLYTDCPMGCMPMAQKIDEVRKEIGHPEHFHVVSFSVNSEGETSEKIDAFMERNGIDAQNWWYLTAPDDRLEKYVSRYFRLIAPRRLTDPDEVSKYGLIEHDFRVVLVDGKANVRGYYKLLDKDFGQMDMERLKRDIRYILENESTPTAPADS